MPRTRACSSSPQHTTSSSSASYSGTSRSHSPYNLVLRPPIHNDGRIPCPFKDYDECGNGISGRGYVRSSFQRHLNDIHFPTDQAKQQCRERLATYRGTYIAWEAVLQHMRCWLCRHCMIIHAWKKTCNHNNVIIAGPVDKDGHVKFLISDIPSPPTTVSDTPITETDTLSVSLSPELLNDVFQRHFTIISSVPPPCRPYKIGENLTVVSP
ncbi:uncharacterized protein LOC113321449 isoform X1 [Papaver somniferum]|uniref:uncharacterized protein LOC113321449 isoform X1 n=1 Tax=Papaver somniferum TaxID=3469 RepID=UPI000E704F71|nr:uncharacterized protein LOC113321449 isoform X1 [Papaver somniferum]